MYNKGEVKDCIPIEYPKRYTPAQIRLLCAGCGPLHLDEGCLFLPEIGRIDGITLRGKMYSIEIQPDFDILQESWADEPDVRSLARELEQERQEIDRLRGYDRLSDMALLTARARYALLEGKTGDFLSLYHRVCSLITIEWKIWQERQQFWEMLLGSALAGADAVPVCPTTQELRNLIYLRSAFQALPLVIDSYPNSYHLSVAWDGCSAKAN